MISQIPFDVWYCDICGRVWLSRMGGSGEVPKRCPNRACRKLGGARLEPRRWEEVWQVND